MNKYLAFICAFLLTLTIALVPAVRMESERTQPGSAVAQSSGAISTYEIDVLSGVQPESGFANLHVTCRWHTGSCVAGGLFDKGAALDLRRYQVPVGWLEIMASWLATVKHPVYASFRHVAGAKDLKIRFMGYDSKTTSCRKVIAEVFNNGIVIAEINYTHVAMPPPEIVERVLYDLPDTEDRMKVAEIAWPHYNNPEAGDNSHAFQSLSDLHGLENWTDGSGCDSTAPHLHQEVKNPEGSPQTVWPHRDDRKDAGTGVHLHLECHDSDNFENDIRCPGIAQPYGNDEGHGGYHCISSSMWLWKISDRTTQPPLYAAPGTNSTCPPTNLSLKSGSALTLEFDSSDNVRFELYKADGGGAFCNADASSCVHDGTAAAASASNTTTFERRSGNEPWSSGKYRARGQGCGSNGCGAWSGWSDTIDHIAPPTGLALKSSRDGQLGVHYTRVDIPDAGWHEFALYQADTDGRFCDVCDALTTVPQPATRATPGENTEAPTLFGLQPDRAYKARARSCRSGGPGPGGVPADNCGAWSDFTPTIYHASPPESIGLVSSSGNLGVSFKSLRAARFQLYKSSGSTCTVGAAGCTLVATITAGTSASAALRQATFGQRTGGAYWVRGQSCLTSGAGGSGGVGGAAGTPGPRVATDACGAWSALSPQFTHRVPSFGTSRVSDQSWTEGSSVSLTLPAATGGDGTLTYSLSPALPSGVTRTNFAVSGAPSAVKTRTMHTWTATDENGDKASITFHVTVNAAPPPPTVTPTRRCTLTVYASPQKGGTVSGGTTVDCSSSTEAKAEAEANTGYRFSHWSGDGTGTGASERTVTMSADRSVTAHFEPTLACDGNTFVFEVGRSSSKTLSAARNGSGTITYSDGTGRPTWLAFDAPTHAVSGTPPRAGAWLFSTLSTDADGNKAYCPHLVEGKKIPYTVTATVSPNTAWGSVTKSPAGPNYYYGNSVTLTANANPGYRFVRWSNGASGTSTTARVTVTGTVSVTATFEKTYTLSVSVTKTARGYLHGSVTRTPWKAAYAHNDRVTLRANANPGYRFVRWSGAASGASTTARVTMNGDKTVKAHFELIPLPPCDPSVPGSCACPPSFPICGNAEDEGG